ncbi:hypothetical protein ABE021_13855 [Sporosarcina gallistercoris]|uniref:hypothetical protein n=1 Tax=Sporosarcina gallistercoris TaxID=2762245 RepID=UPI003D28C1DE
MNVEVFFLRGHVIDQLWDFVGHVARVLDLEVHFTNQFLGFSGTLWSFSITGHNSPEEWDWMNRVRFAYWEGYHILIWSKAEFIAVSVEIYERFPGFMSDFHAL